MAYTMARLQRAKRLFLGDNLSNRGNESLAEYLDQLSRPKYSFRKRNPRAETALSSAWIDRDDTSDYEPTEKKTATKRKRASRMEDAGPSRSTKKAAKPSRLVVKMSVKSDTGKAWLGAFPSGEEKGSDSEIDEDSYWNKYWEVPEILEGELGSRYALRKRDKHGDGGALGDTPTTVSLE